VAEVVAELSDMPMERLLARSRGCSKRRWTAS
jgi:hypothetical protein